ncbi:MAG: DNA translocase FtsK 4TM domain-containing protein [Flavobacteriaceae bacterium]
MAKKQSTSPKSSTASADPKKRQRQILLGIFLLILSLGIFISISAFIWQWKADFSTLNAWNDKSVSPQNPLQKIGVWTGYWLVYQWFGFAAYIFTGLLLWTGLNLFFNAGISNLLKRWIWGAIYMLLWIIAGGFFAENFPLVGGIIGFEIHEYLSVYVGKLGIFFLWLFFVLTAVIVKSNLRPEELLARLKQFSFKKTVSPLAEENTPPSGTAPMENVSPEEPLDIQEKDEANPVTQNKKIDFDLPLETTPPAPTPKSTAVEDPELAIEIKSQNEELTAEQNKAQELVEAYGTFDPRLELSNFKLPDLDLLKDYGSSSITIDQEELEQNKNKIVDTLRNYKIAIAQIKATIGPTVTLYEIVPEAGIRISKIKNLEDDIALSLSALGIRIIAPIPGKGTIGIEVPNQKPSVVSIRSVISSQKFQQAEMELPVALGKNISNETFVVDLAKMPHLLMAGATGQGKSVGLNTVLTSLLYKKHPAEVKFVLVDPKKVELTIYNKIERHYLAKLPDSDEAIITDNSKVINTLNSLCIEMDNRYELLKNGLCRNIKEYNEKFKSRRLNPEEGHQFLPYIVLVVDEFADLIMTAGKEVETPIARLAQLARAVGIHLIIATQRPSVNVITGIIKANFPARIAFRVTSKIDSRTILDSGGADQLIGRGDMLYTQGNELTRIQCAFVDTPEVDKIANYIGAQRAYPDAHLLPEYVGEDSGSTLDIDASERDALFREAAEVIVTAQQGSASLLQRKLKLGYNRAGRIIDQMEAAGIVGPFEGSKARQVLVPDLMALEQLLNANTE